MNENQSKSNLETISDIVKAINDYSVEELGNDLAHIQTRVENVVIYKRINEDENQAKKDPNYYKIKAIENLHAKASIEYTEVYSSTGSDYHKKASLFGHLYVMNQQLLNIEGGKNEDEN